ncbi:MAG: DUF4335 domain-containing protein [Cyanobacteria bacterium P01_H01_bin.162]
MTSTTQLTPLRYDSPTVTLEVMARSAAVSQWSDKPVVQVLRYQLDILSLEDGGQPVEIRGDRDSFLPLINAVQTYLQSQLVGDPMARGDRDADQPYLVPDGLTRHTLHLGPLRTTNGEATASLGALQLADLGDVVDQLDTQVRPLPVSLVAVSRRPWRQWSTVAAGMVAAMGITTALWPLYQSQPDGDTALQAPSATFETAPATPENQVTPRSAPPADDAETPAAIAEAEPVTPPTNAPPAASQPAGAAGNAPKNTPVTPDSATDEQAVPKPDPSSSAANPAPPVVESEAAPTTPPPSPRPAPRPPAAATTREAAPDELTSLLEEPAEALTDTAPTPSEADSFPGVIEGQTDTSAPAAIAAPEAESAAASTGSTGEVTLALSALDTLLKTLRDRWTPPEGLEQTLTYRLVFDADDMLVEVIPQDALAEQYRDRTGLPLLSTPDLPTDDATIIDLLFQPDGTVEMVNVTPN